MKIGILTFHRSMNFGALLQAYGLQATLEQLGAHVEIIDYRCEQIEKEIKAFSIPQTKSISNIVKVFVKYLYRTRKNYKFNQFFNEYLNLSKSCYNNIAELATTNTIYDYFIVGSDQVWNGSITNNDTAYFLEFVNDNSKKYSYAASIAGGEKQAEDTIKKFGNYLNKFSKVSIRESNILDVFSRELGSKVQVTLDPTLLLTKEMWTKIASPRLIKKKYIFMYLIGAPKNIIPYAQRLARQNGYLLIDNKSSLEFFKKCGPSDFLSWILNAEIVITNSFHGTAFSIIFEKCFNVELVGQNGGYNYRSRELLDTLEIKDREIVSDIPLNGTNSVINYDIVERKLERLREKSIDYLQSLIK